MFAHFPVRRRAGLPQAPPVVLPPQPGVPQDVVGVVGPLELCLGVRVLRVHVRVVLLGQPEVGLPDLPPGGGAVQAQVVVVGGLAAPGVGGGREDPPGGGRGRREHPAAGGPQAEEGLHAWAEGGSLSALYRLHWHPYCGTQKGSEEKIRISEEQCNSTAKNIF